jgi:hypothetical protein
MTNNNALHGLVFENVNPNVSQILLLKMKITKMVTEESHAGTNADIEF